MVVPDLLPEDIVERLNERRGRPVGGVKRKRLLVVASSYCALRFKIRRDVRASEGIDRLLGVSDHEQRSLLRLWPIFDFVHLAREDAPEDIPLRLVGVLKFVYKRNAVFMAYGLEQRAFLAQFGLCDDDIVGSVHKIVERQCGDFFLKALELRPCEKYEVSKHLRGKHAGRTLNRFKQLPECGNMF